MPLKSPSFSRARAAPVPLGNLLWLHWIFTLSQSSSCVCGNYCAPGKPRLFREVPLLLESPCRLGQPCYLGKLPVPLPLYFPSCIGTALAPLVNLCYLEKLLCPYKTPCFPGPGHLPCPCKATIASCAPGFSLLL